MTGSTTLAHQAGLDLGVHAPEVVLTRARGAAPLPREHAADIEQARKLPDIVVELRRQTGVFRMCLARACGGPEPMLPQQTEVVEELAYGDALAGWCAVIGRVTRACHWAWPAPHGSGSEIKLPTALTPRTPVPTLSAAPHGCPPP